MRLAERLSRLERSQDAGSRMTMDDMDAAAARYEAELEADGTPCGRSVADALFCWRDMVEQAAGTWQQRVWAGMSPADLTL